MANRGKRFLRKRKHTQAYVRISQKILTVQLPFSTFFSKIRFKEERNKEIISDVYFDIHKRVIPAVNFPLYPL